MKLFLDDRAYEFDMDRFTNKEVMAIERVTGLTAAEWGEATRNGSMLAMTALIWVVQKRDQPDLRFDDVEFNVASVRIEGAEELGDGEGEPGGKDDEVAASD